MFGRSLSILVLATTAACGGGRIVPADEPTPSASGSGGGSASSGQPATPSPAIASDTGQAATPAAPSAGTYAAPPDSTRTAAAVPVAPAAPAPAAAAAAPAPATGYAPYDSSTAIAIRRVGQWSTSGITTPERLVIRDDSAYAKFWASLGDASSRPSVDFTHDIVIVAAAGQQPTGGHSIAVERVIRVGAGLAVEVATTVPSKGCMTTQALTQPVDVVVVAAADARTWSFADRSVAGGC